jgi:hypothetical protein
MVDSNQPTWEGFMTTISLNEAIALITAVLTAGALAAALWQLTNKRIRNRILVGVGFGLCFVLGVLARQIIWHRTEFTAQVPDSPRPTPIVPSPTPKDPEPKPSPKKEIPPKIEPPDTEGVPLYASSFDDHSARARYCIVGDFTAESIHHSKEVAVTLTNANINLCNYSAHGPRAVMVRVGAAQTSGTFVWSRPVRLLEAIHPGETITLSKPIRLLIPKRGSGVSNKNFVVELINVPHDTKREMRYTIRGRDAALVAQLIEPH